MIESESAPVADDDFEQQRRAVSSREYPQGWPRNLDVEDDPQLVANNRSLELVNNAVTQAQQASGAQSKYSSGKKPPRANNFSSTPGAQIGSNQSNPRQYNTIGRMSQNRLDVISEDEGAHAHLSQNRAMLEQVAKNARDTLPDCPSDTSSTNAYLARKKKIMELINQQQNAQQSDGYISVTEQPIFVNIDGASQDRQQRTVEPEGFSQHSGRVEATQVVLN